MGLFVLIMLLLMVKAGTMQMSDNTCSTSCAGNSKFDYMTGHTYTYIYKSDISTQIEGTSDDKASVHLSAFVHLEILGKCEVSMKLNKVDFSEYGQDDSKMKRISNDFKIGLERNPARFSYQDGRIEDICIPEDEPIWVLNVKRGIISLIQNNMDDFSTSVTVLETDVSGICNTMYSVLESYEDYFSIQKSKDLVSCTDRHSFKSFIQGVPYTSKSYIKSLPLMKSDYNCKSEIESGLLKSVQCVEKNMLRPFSKSDSGAVTVNKQFLTFVRRSSSGTQPQGKINIRRSLKFEHAHGIEKESNNRHDITSKLVEICENTRSGVDTDTPKLFEELVYIMKLADIDTLFAMNKFLTDDTLCKDNYFRTRKFFLDALPFIGTRASIHMITDLITRNAIHEHEADMWLSSLSFIKKPTKEMLKEILPLVTEDINSEKVMLSIGTLIHNYCVHHDDCENDDFIKTIISAITVKISTGCRVDNNNRKPTLRLLKGLGNAGFADISTLTECMTLKSNPLDIRLSAIQATRREPCRSNRMALITLLQDESDSYETRIAAYKMLMACPSKNVIDAVKLTLTREPRNQISSYIWTHLSNLLRTSDIYKQDIGNILGDEALKRRFDLDNKKFARNYATSGFIEKLNTGSKIEADLIWSLRSSVPHSGMLNVTFDVFGQSVNIFEIGGRVEGLEKSIVEYLRSDRFFANTYPGMRLRDFLDDGKSFSGHPDDLRGSLYLRMFGNEIFTMDIKEAETYLSGRDIISKIIKDDNFTFTQSVMFLDSKYMVPTSSGFTLSLTLRGTATVDLFKQSRRDVIYSDKFGISRRFRPSATVYIASMMSVDTFVTKSGIKLVSTLHTSTSLQGKIKTTKNGFFTFEYEMPDTVMKIFGINSSIYIVRTDSELEQTKIGKHKRNLSYCYKQMTVAGLELCAEVEYPLHSVTSTTPYFPLTGPFGAGVYLYNRDTHVKYIIVAKSVISRGKRIINFTFNTPGSSINRQMKFYLFLNTNNGIIKTIISSPWKRIDFEGMIYFVNNNFQILFD
ncbi:apolipophorins-like isoform X2 [Ruditapes philippinarum]|uniref:apolipophorins-like isoform X2 n=1 Tax=Ruditapes philippinarum TaxID=129788 RepID=UPI00295BA697|nr:apolipophorins-like isoform X2 [Ruditapes philippinarum]